MHLLLPASSSRFERRRSICQDKKIQVQNLKTSIDPKSLFQYKLTERGNKEEDRVQIEDLSEKNIPLHKQDDLCQD